MSLIDIFLIFLKWKIQSDALKKNEFFVTFKYQMDKSLVKVNIKNMLSLGVYEQKIRSTAYWSYGISFGVRWMDQQFPVLMGRTNPCKTHMIFNITLSI